MVAGVPQRLGSSLSVRLSSMVHDPNEGCTVIDNPLPSEWTELQEGVRRILRNIGLLAEVEVELQTPRGSVIVDVFAVDVGSVDQIKYVVECKNWGTGVPKTVVHAFTTVMAETGANIGFIISKHGLQSGAEEYTKNTNITGLTYLEFQQRYFKVWWLRYFCPRIGNAADRVLQYVEEFNPARDSLYAGLGDTEKAEFDNLRRTHGVSVTCLSMFNIVYFPGMGGSLRQPPADLLAFKSGLLAKIAPHIEWHATSFRGLLEIILQFLTDVEESFNALFGGQYPFDLTPIGDVGPDGPALVPIQ